MATFLIAGDSMVMRTILKYLVERTGGTVIAEAKDAHEAVKLALEKRPDAVTLDLRIRGADSGATPAAIQQGVDGVKVFISVEGAPSAERLASLQGSADGVLRKPYELAQVSAEIQRVMP